MSGPVRFGGRLAVPVLAAAVLALAGAPAALAQDEVRVFALLQTEEVRVGETAVLEVRVETDGPGVEDVELPSLPSALRVTGSRDYSQLQFNLPGGRSRTLRREFFIVPSAPGTYDIRPVSVRVRGRRYYTAPLTLTVTGAGGVPAADTEDQVRLRAWLEPGDTVYVGQQVTMVVEALYGDAARVRTHRALRHGLPRPPGFWIQELPEDPLPETRIVDGRAFQVHGARVAFFPVEPGEFMLAPATLRYDVRRGFLQTPESRELATDSLRLVVLPLPAEGRPDGFTGAVGHFEVTARLEPGEVPAGEAAVLTVDVAGEGNIRGLPPPRLVAVDGLEVYSPGEEAEVEVIDGIVGGAKRFSWVLVPRRGGSFVLPPVEYAYFDPMAEEYAIAASPPMTVVARSGPGVPASPTAVAVRGLKPGPASTRLGWVWSPAFAALQILPLLALGALILRRRPVERPRSRRRALRRERERGMKRIRGRLADDPRGAADELAIFVRSWTAARLGLTGLPGADPASALAGALPDATVSAFRRLVARVDNLRYRPDGPDAGSVDARLDEAAALLERLDAEAPPQSAASRGAAAAALAALVMIVTAGCGEATEGDGGAAGAFRDAAAAYHAGDLDAALDGFAALVSDYPRDANAWYNLGNAYYARAETGRAVWAWSRAAALRPRDGDARANLGTVAGADPGLATAGSVPMSREEILLILAVAWWLAVGGAALTLVQQRRTPALVGGGALVVALFLAGAWALPRGGEPSAIVLEPETPLHASPAERAEVRAHLPEGSAVRVRELREGWTRVRTADGGDGWIPAPSLGRL